MIEKNDTKNAYGKLVTCGQYVKIPDLPLSNS